jgi:hypothetical protein
MKLTTHFQPLLRSRMVELYIHSSIYLHCVVLNEFSAGTTLPLPYEITAGGQSSWLQIQRSGFDSRRYQNFWEVVGLERGPLSLVSTTEELFERKSSGSGIEIREYCHRDLSRWPCGTLCQKKLALISPTSGGRSVGIVRSRTHATEFSLFLKHSMLQLHMWQRIFVAPSWNTPINWVLTVECALCNCVSMSPCHCTISDTLI